ncbi:unnamed protein product [Mytilus edulis]|uniref:Uncharacterized protein n=1 Tax=Mytilus edulis TaxID=6550 RepID=A0A8S3S003_MYTED|nr:unnamed protein product [Mytilus edulis]
MADVFAYLVSLAKWTPSRLRTYKNERGFRLSKSNHISSAEIFKLPHEHYYIKASCIRETSQKADPYMTWCLVNSEGDTVDSYSGSSKLRTILNSFGILSSKIKCRQHESAIVEEKISTKFLEDLDRAAFTVVSIDNIDVGQPHASAKINDPQRGIHATSYQALQPKPNTLNIGSSEPSTTEKGFSPSKLTQDKQICTMYVNKILEVNVFGNNSEINRSLLKLFSCQKFEGVVHFDLMNFYNIGHPYEKKTLRTFATTKSKQHNKRNTDTKEKTLYNRCLKSEMAFSVKSGNPLSNFRQYIPFPRAICMTDGSMHHQDTKSNATRSLCGRYESVQLERLPESFNEHLVIIEGMFMINSKPIRSHHKAFNDILEYLVRR